MIIRLSFAISPYIRTLCRPTIAKQQARNKHCHSFVLAVRSFLSVKFALAYLVAKIGKVNNCTFKWFYAKPSHSPLQILQGASGLFCSKSANFLVSFISIVF